MNNSTQIHPGKSTGNRRVLLVEDNQVTARAYKRMLQKQGFTVVHIADGTSAFHAIRDQEFDLVLLDLMLPEMDGVEILKRTHEQNQDFQTPVVVLTEADLEVVRQQVLQYGVKQFFTKTGADALKIVQAIKTLLAQPAQGDNASDPSTANTPPRSAAETLPANVIRLHMASATPLAVRKISDVSEEPLHASAEQLDAVSGRTPKGGRAGRLLRKFLFVW